MIDETLMDGIAFAILHSTPDESAALADSLLIKKLRSKQWLIDNVLEHHGSPLNTLMLGAWYPILIPYQLGGKYTFVDTDPSVVNLTKKFWKRVYKTDQIEYNIIDAYDYLYMANQRKFDLIINTSCEHMTFDMSEFVVDGPTYVLQSNNYTSIDEHINCKQNITEFVNSCGLNNILYQGTLETEKYERYMVIGRV